MTKKEQIAEVQRRLDACKRQLDGIHPQESNGAMIDYYASLIERYHEELDHLEKSHEAT